MEEDGQNTNQTLIRQLIDSIEDNLANHLPSNAVFLAERLLAEQDTEETRGILAECYMAENKHYKVYDILKLCKSEMNRYRFALVCLKLNKNQDGEKALLMENYNPQDQNMQSKHRSQMLPDYVPNGCYGFYLLGLIYEGQQKFQEAKNYFVKALELNPTLWVAYEKICKIGDQEILPYKIFCETKYKQYINSKKAKGLYSFNPQVNFLRNFKESAGFYNSTDETEDGNSLANQVANKQRIPNQAKDQGLQRNPAQQAIKPGTSNISTIGQVTAGRNDSNSRNNSAKRKKSGKLDNGVGLLSSIPSQPSSGSSNIQGGQNSQLGVGSQQFPAASSANQYIPGQMGNSSVLQFDSTSATLLGLQQKMSSSVNNTSTSQQQQQQILSQGLNLGMNNPNQFISANSQFQNLQNTVNSPYIESRYGGSQDYYQFQKPTAAMQSTAYNIYAQQGGVNKNLQTPQINMLLSNQMNQHQLQSNIQPFFGAPGFQQQLSANDFSQSVSSSATPIRDICTLLRRFGEAFYHMSLYLCKEAIDYFFNLPKNHQQTGWVLTHIGRCYMEIVKYSEAEKYYTEALRIEPYRLEGIEYYSSCLWHLKKQVELCYLAHQALDKSLFAPETWIAVGNCFSLQKEHENALKFFQRAIQLNQQSAYAHALCGHEFVYNEDFARARKSFQQALNLDLRNYNAWWGLGNIFYKQEKYNRAAEHFQNAIKINQKNPVLYSFMGMTLAADRNYSSALQYFEQSEKLDPKNGLNKFQKANTLVKLEKYEAALKELQELNLMMPKEAPIPMLMGKVYKKLNKTDLALKYFTDALDLENKDTQRIKALIESLHQENQDFGEDLEI
ncbi:tetratricopeptide repeat protein (macronuclear) [Tetrahymena thermophila SB210]|uniref:Tetratricopeptide repeat protein n=1 Tax=Tetrahymena thermophila (strain SB210) TaxID=312017 RepID=I7LZP8_TETTS|nr:tetratricopeptide repeat protein [Tetrahymena thermophila SB210]EAR84490.2 tetratricopeptide repeat protein [Tetrahymena thermophila SB210]|eukprot:XP_001032153.2 tetratricopeptide repeat protein [Tetrahymena thermophila SB210]